MQNAPFSSWSLLVAWLTHASKNKKQSALAISANADRRHLKAPPFLAFFGFWVSFRPQAQIRSEKPGIRHSSKFTTIPKIELLSHTM